MIEWVNDDRLKITFSTMPEVAVRYITPVSTAEEKKSIKKKPFICTNEISVTILEKYQPFSPYKFKIPKDYTFDGASIPKFFHRVIGANTDNTFLIPALIHDTLCENHHYINNDRELSTCIFDSLLKVGGVSDFKRELMRNSVAVFQLLFGHWGGE